MASSVQPPLVVAAIDFGTTYSSWAFSFLHEFERDPTRVSCKHWVGGPLVSQKGPTSILIRKDDETVDSFGFEAETRYAEEENKDGFYFFSRFKMMLHGKIGIDRHLMLQDPTGKEMSARKVFSLAIKFLIDDFLEDIRKQDEDLEFEDYLRLVLTVPAIWNDAAKQFMREAAVEAGISADKLVIALEPEAASIYCRHLPVNKQERGDRVSIATLKPGSKYIVLDAGGGTVDVTVHEVLETGHLKEIHAPTGGAWGGALVDMAFKDFLNKCAGKTVMGYIKRTYPEDFIYIMRNFEMQKRLIRQDNPKPLTVRLPMSSFEEAAEETGQPFIKDALEANLKDQKAKIKGDKLIIDFDVVEIFFTKPVKLITAHVKSLITKPDISECFGIIMVGGFSESELLQNHMRASFPGKRIIIPNEAGVAVLKGAVIFGHQPETVSQRISRFTYGCSAASRDTTTYSDGERFLYKGSEFVRNVFNTLVRAGDVLNVGWRKTCNPVAPMSTLQTEITVKFYATEKLNPKYVTDVGCQCVGVLTIDVGLFKMATINVSLLFGGTELKVELESTATGEKKICHINFLG